MWFWQDVIGNLAIVALFVSSWRYVAKRLDDRPLVLRRLIAGIALGLGAGASMLFSVIVQDGYIFDLRLGYVMVASLFGGPIAGLASAVTASAMRYLMGGTGVPVGVALIVATSLLGILANFAVRKFDHPRLVILALSLATGVTVWCGFEAIPETPGKVAGDEVALFAAVSSTIAAFILSLVLRNRLAASDERSLMRVAFLQTPDYQFVKDRQGRFVAANRNTAGFWGVDDPVRLHGKSHRELSSDHDARLVQDEEAALMAAGGSVTDHQECIIDSAGNKRWFSTSKSTVFSGDGRVIGLAGIARDITDQKNVESELEYSRHMLSYALAEMSDGLAMFDENGVMVFCNDQFRNSFPLTADVIVAGVHYKEILRNLAESGQELNVPAEPSDVWVEGVIASMQNGRAHEIQLADGHWLRMKARLTAEGKTIATVSDLTEMKMANQALLTLTTQLKTLAATDGLTGLMNRREFDASLNHELRQSERSKISVSLLLVDVDNFKSFNDLYGHLAGDDCLRAISACLKQTPRRPGDRAARFGGEEFVVILSDTDEVSALKLAEDLRRRLVDLSLIHEGNKEGIVTVSIGIATYAADAVERSADDLIQRADEALYQAKDSGRNCVISWHASSEPGRAAG